MISSPCTDCHNKDRPKEKCAKNCEVLQAVQFYQALIEKSDIEPAIDYTEEWRFYIHSKEAI